MPAKILAFGELLWDMLPSGKQIGGAPGNFAYHCRALGAEAALLSRVGDDPLGHELVTAFRQRQVPTGLLQIDPAAPTGTVDVMLVNGQPSYRIVESVAWDRITLEPDALDAVRSSDALCFGSLACRTANNRQTLYALLDALRSEAKAVLDLNLRAPFYSPELIAELLPRADVLKINDEELLVLAKMLGVSVDSSPLFAGRGVLARDKQRFVQWLLDRYDPELLVLTCGNSGSFLFARDGRASFVPAMANEVISAVGAGDSFTACCLVCYLAGAPLEEINTKAARLAAYVCSCLGGMPEIPPELVAELTR